jgi:hypothetical protein
MFQTLVTNVLWNSTSRGAGGVAVYQIIAKR